MMVTFQVQGHFFYTPLLLQKSNHIILTFALKLIILI